MRAEVREPFQVIVVLATFNNGQQDVATFSCETTKRAWLDTLPRGTVVKSAPTFMDAPEFDQMLAPRPN